jgi:hypothetical protein
MLCQSELDIQSQLRSMLSSEGEFALTKTPEHRFFSLRICIFDPLRNSLLRALEEKLEDAYPELSITNAGAVDAIPESPVFILAEDRCYEELSLAIALRKQAFILLLSHAPSQFRPLFDSHPRILAISHRPDILVAHVRLFIRPEESFFRMPAVLASQLDIYVVGQSFHQKHLWTKAVPHSASLHFLANFLSIPRKDLYSRPSLLVCNELHF